MANPEYEKNFGASPELFDAGRELINPFSPHSQLERELTDFIPDQIAERTLLSSLSEDESVREQVLYFAETSTSPKDKKQKPNPWEPFNTEPVEGQRFINLYGGPFSQQLELHRDNAERFIRVAGIEGNIFLVDAPRDRNYSAVVTSVNSEGSATAGKVKTAEKNKSTRSIPEGWRIEIPGEDILDELSRNHSGETLNKRVVDRINTQIRTAINSIIVKDKLSLSGRNLMDYSFTFASIPYDYVVGATSVADIAIGLFVIWIGMGLGDKIFELRGINYFRSRKSFYEMFMPPIEIDRVIRGLLFANIKGKNLVRLKETAIDL